MRPLVIILFSSHRIRWSHECFTNLFLKILQILPEEVEAELKEAAVISMGSDVSDVDLMNIKELCDQVLSLSEYRAQLYDYLKNRMNTIAPNLTALVGELVGARLIAHGGSLLNLAKQPGSTVQILGAEKALFRALKTKHATPKYGLLYHASLVGQAPPKMKGKMSRSLAAKAALTIRYDALGDGQDDSMGLENRLKVCYRSLPIGTMATSSFLLQLLFWEDNFDTVICSLKHD